MALSLAPKVDTKRDQASTLIETLPYERIRSMTAPLSPVPTIRIWNPENRLTSSHGVEQQRFQDGDIGRVFVSPNRFGSTRRQAARWKFLICRSDVAYRYQILDSDDEDGGSPVTKGGYVRPECLSPLVIGVENAWDKLKRRLKHHRIW